MVDKIYNCNNINITSFYGYRLYVVLSNPDIAIYTHNNSHFIANASIRTDGGAMISIYVPYEKGLLGCRYGEIPKAVSVICLDDYANIGVNLEQKFIYDIGDMKQYGIDPIYIGAENGLDYQSRSTVFTTTDGSQFVVYQKYNKVYLHVVED